jgi:hypothetical protein
VDDVLLHCPTVVHLADILEEHRLSVDVFDWNVAVMGASWFIVLSRLYYISFQRDG